MYVWPLTLYKKIVAVKCRSVAHIIHSDQYFKKWNSTSFYLGFKKYHFFKNVNFYGKKVSFRFVGIGIKLFQRVLPNIYRITVPFHSSKIPIDSFIDVSWGLISSL